MSVLPVGGHHAEPGPGAIVALALSTGVTLPPEPHQRIRFGRNRPQVELCIGEDDLRISRLHGVIDRRDGQWAISNTGRTLIRLPAGRRLAPGDDPLPLVPGYTPLFVRGSRGREHLLEVYVIGADGTYPRSLHDAITHAPKRYALSDQEKLILVVLGQRYLAQEEFAQPLGRQQVAEQLAELRPDQDWTDRKVEHAVKAVRLRLHKDGVRGLIKEELAEPIGNMLNHNLIHALIDSATLVPSDLALLPSWD